MCGRTGALESGSLERIGGGCGTRKMGIGDKNKHVWGCENAIIYMGICVRLLMKWLDIFLLSNVSDGVMKEIGRAHV